MTTHFADTSYYIALVNGRDEFHAAAVEFAQKYRNVALVPSKQYD